MTPALPQLEISTAPFVRAPRSTRAIMFEVLATLAPVVAVGAYFFGLSALLVVGAATAGCVATEWFFLPDRREWGTLKNGSALLTGVILGLTLPPALPLWMAFLGGAVGIGLGKLIWGGLGMNLFNPALVGRAFLQSAFPVALTTWTAPGGSFSSLEASTLAPPFFQASADVVSSASPLGMAKFEGAATDLLPLALGNTSGSVGETSGLLLLACGVWLAIRRVFDWRLPVSALLTVAAASAVFHWANPTEYPGAAFMVFSGGMLFGAVYMVTDPVTTPLTPKGAWIFGVGTGLLVVLIRLFGGLPEGVMYAILLMNAVTPLINRRTQPRRFGG